MKLLIMENNITLTNDEIHTIRVEHSEKNRNNKLQVNKYARASKIIT